MYRTVLIILLAIGLSSCGKETVKDEPVTKQDQKTEQSDQVENKEAQNAAAKASDTAVVSETAEETEVTDNTAVDETLENVTGSENEKPDENLSVEDSVPEAVTMDSTEVFYMIRPNDYLVKIAINEYGRPTMWRKIWKWNYDMIGENPDLIYPYRELSLLKPVEYAVQTEYEFYNYTVKKDDTLWSIAKQEYDNNLAWIVILRDNYDTISDDYNNLEESTVLKLRTKLY